MEIYLTPEEVDAVEKWQRYHNETQETGGKAFYTYKYNGAQLQSTDPVEASHLKDLIKGNEDDKNDKFFKGHTLKSPFINIDKWEQMSETEQRSIIDDLVEKISNSHKSKVKPLNDDKQSFHDVETMDRVFAEMAKDKCDNTETENDMVQHPSHYADSAIETIDYIRDKLTQEEFTGLCTGNVLKYTSRWRKKGGVQDLEKALVYLQWAIESEKRDVK